MFLWSTFLAAEGVGELTLHSAFVHDVVFGSNGSLTVPRGRRMPFLVGSNVFFLMFFPMDRWCVILGVCLQPGIATTSFASAEERERPMAKSIEGVFSFSHIKPVRACGWNNMWAGFLRECPHAVASASP